MSDKPTGPRKCATCGDKAKYVDWCYGCRAFVCAACDNPSPDLRPAGTHKVAAHVAWKGKSN